MAELVQTGGLKLMGRDRTGNNGTKAGVKIWRELKKGKDVIWVFSVIHCFCLPR